jgi:hypothetical protein
MCNRKDLNEGGEVVGKKERGQRSRKRGDIEREGQGN